MSFDLARAKRRYAKLKAIVEDEAASSQERETACTLANELVEPIKVEAARRQREEALAWNEATLARLAHARQALVAATETTQQNRKALMEKIEKQKKVVRVASLVTLLVVAVFAVALALTGCDEAPAGISTPKRRTPAAMWDRNIEVSEDTARCVTCYIFHGGVNEAISCVARCLPDGGSR